MLYVVFFFILLVTLQESWQLQISIVFQYDCYKLRTCIYMLGDLVFLFLFFLFSSTTRIKNIVACIDLCQDYSSRGFYALILCHLQIYISSRKDHSPLYVFVCECERKKILKSARQPSYIWYILLRKKDKRVELEKKKKMRGERKRQRRGGGEKKKKKNTPLWCFL